MTTAATNAVYSQVFKKKLGDVLRVGTGGGLCFCGINMYFKNDKFYDDWVMPIFGKLDPETACSVAQKAAKYKLVSEEKLMESKLLVSMQPSRSALEMEDLLLPGDVERGLEGDDLASSKENLFESLANPGARSTLPSMLFDSECENDEVCLDMSVEEENTSCSNDSGSGFESAGKPGDNAMRYLSDGGHLGSDLSCCNSPNLERNCVTPDSPSLSMRVNVASPLRTSKMSLATMIEGSNPAYDRMHLDEDLEMAEEGFASEGECVDDADKEFERTEEDVLVEIPAIEYGSENDS